MFSGPDILLSSERLVERRLGSIEVVDLPKNCCQGCYSANTPTLIHLISLCCFLFLKDTWRGSQTPGLVV